MIQAKQELSNLAQTQRVAHHTYEQLVHRLKGEREENLQSITGIHNLVKSTVRNSDEEPSKANLSCPYIDELKQEVHRFKKTVIVSKEDIERSIDALKTSFKPQAEDQRKLEKKIDSQYQDDKGYMQDALAEVSKIDLRLEDLERTNPAFKVDNHAEVRDTQNDTQNDTGPGKEIVDIDSDSDIEPVKSTSKRSRESLPLSRNGSTERPPQKKKRTKRDDDDSDEVYNEYSQTYPTAGCHHT
ncbi:MAG: hypothetical protein Q9204_000795 [Flavoplaca sp. TL-2023a]